MSAAGRFRITASPTFSSTPEGVVILRHVDFCATCEGDVTRTWRVETESLTCLFDILESEDLATDLICDLYEGNDVTLPGDYSAVHLVVLGFRMPFKKAPHRAGVPATIHSRFG